MNRHQHFPQYTRSSIPNARRMRREMTDAQVKIWRELRGNQMGVKFRRELPYGPYILDFYCRKARLDVELDGSQHYTRKGQEHDRVRDRYLRGQGIEVLRFDDVDALTNTYNVLDTIFHTVRERLGENDEDETPILTFPHQRRASLRGEGALLLASEEAHNTLSSEERVRVRSLVMKKGMRPHLNPSLCEVVDLRGEEELRPRGSQHEQMCGGS